MQWDVSKIRHHAAMTCVNAECVLKGGDAVAHWDAFKIVPLVNGKHS